jgi:hypothetical protein
MSSEAERSRDIGFTHYYPIIYNNSSSKKDLAKKCAFFIYDEKNITFASQIKERKTPFYRVYLSSKYEIWQKVRK